MKIIEGIDDRDFEGNGSRSVYKKPHNTSDPDSISSEKDIRGIPSDNPLDILIARNKEGELLESDPNPVIDEERIGGIVPELDSENDEHNKEEVPATTEGKGDVVFKEPTIRAALTARKPHQDYEKDKYLSKSRNKGALKESHVPKRKKFKVVNH